jgi:WD40 repeat protein
MVLNASDLSVVGTGKASDHSITAVRFSPDGKVFACAASNFKIYVHEVAGPESNYKLLAVAEKHSGIVKDVDFSSDSVYFQGISQSSERIACKFY